MDFFYDTYAIMSLIEGNEDYVKYKANLITTSILNFAEIYNIFLRNNGKQTADYWGKKLNFNFIDIDKASIIKAVEFRFIHRKKDLSLTDCIGYVLSLKHNMGFLTGDSKFKEMKNVVFVK